MISLGAHNTPTLVYVTTKAVFYCITSLATLDERVELFVHSGSQIRVVWQQRSRFYSSRRALDSNNWCSKGARYHAGGVCCHAHASLLCNAVSSLQSSWEKHIRQHSLAIAWINFSTELSIEILNMMPLSLTFPNREGSCDLDCQHNLFTQVW